MRPVRSAAARRVLAGLLALAAAGGNHRRAERP